MPTPHLFLSLSPSSVYIDDGRHEEKQTHLAVKVHDRFKAHDNTNYAESLPGNEVIAGKRRDARQVRYNSFKIRALSLTARRTKACYNTN